MSVTNRALGRLRTIVKSQSHFFACGGEIPISPELKNNPSLALQQSNSLPAASNGLKPVDIRWDMVKSRVEKPSSMPSLSCAKLTLPLTQEGDVRFAQLLKDCQPATFGRGGEDVYDESYRKALKMDPTSFCTTFDPYSLGIVDTIAQVLLPSALDSTTNRAVKAELYKLNVYSAPSGRFKPHVDTPRSALQFGSLVVSLPTQYEGGFLKIRHKGEEVVFDWSNAADRISWAAFYSDCEHEVFEVTSGHRITLTYNLYAVRGAGRLTGSLAPTLRPKDLPFFQQVQDVLARDPFNGRGGTLGVWCSHLYAYNHKAENPLPDVLKGVDAVVWETFQALGLDLKIAPIIPVDSSDLKYLKDLYNDSSFIMHRRADGMPEENPPSEWIVGYDFGMYLDNSDREVEDINDLNDLYKDWGDYHHGPIEWLNKPGPSDLQLAYMTYGNQASMDSKYSHCAILVTFPATHAVQDD